MKKQQTADECGTDCRATCAQGLLAMSERVKHAAAEIGFDGCGISAAGDADPERRLDAWIARGCHAGMDWLARDMDVRRDVRVWLPGARSVIVVARNYYAERPEPEDETGCVARYAWGRDYHRVIGKMLRALAKRVAECGGDVRWSVDAGPVLEKFWAARAGLGFIGKNSLMIMPAFGSWLFLGVIATTLELAPDVATESQCGDCDRCMKACPGQAIVAPAMVDARRCLAYHTVENRGAIPPDIRAVLGNRVFGCDACQEVCPFNYTPRVTSEKAFHPQPGQANPRLQELAGITEDVFRTRFSGTSLMRAKWTGIRRNAIVDED